MKSALSVAVGELGDLEKQILVERHLISRELSGSKQRQRRGHQQGPDVLGDGQRGGPPADPGPAAGLQLKKAWNAIDEIDSRSRRNWTTHFPDARLSHRLPDQSRGPGMRASAMMHLPALVIPSQMEKVVRAVNQLGMVVRGLFGEASDASGSIFQISNQTTLGESEEDIIKRLSSVLNTIIEHELNARAKLMEADSGKLFDKIGRAFGILQNGRLLTSAEAMNLLSLVRLGVDLGVFPEARRPVVDRLFIEAQPGHIQYAAHGAFESSQRDQLRAQFLRTEFANFGPPDFNVTGKN